MPAISILFPMTESPVLGQPSDCSSDLRLDQVVASITAGRAEYGLEALFFTPLTSAEEVRFRQEIFCDLDRGELRPTFQRFAEGMRTVRRLLTGQEQLRSRGQQQAWFLEAAGTYCQAVDALAAGIASADVDSRGLRAIREHLSAYTRSDAYTALRADIESVQDALHSVRYCLNINGNRITVMRDAGDSDYSKQVLDTFERFRQRDLTKRPPGKWASTYMTHIDAQVLDLVARLHPSVFSMLDAFCDRHGSFVDETVATFDREIQFYAAVSEFLKRLIAAGLSVCYPEISDRDKTIEARDVYDIALAEKLVSEQQPVVLNDVILHAGERILVVTGPNQGGKTTFARMFGQLHHFAALGCPVPGTRVELGLFDRIFTHFERTEDVTTLSGKLEDELVRVRRILRDATSRSVVVMNESFTSTSLRDARVLGAAVLDQLIDADLRGVYVTFVDELSRLGPTVVSVVSTVHEDDPALRTYKVIRQPADGLAYAICLAEKHRLTARQLAERIVA